MTVSGQRPRVNYVVWLERKAKSERSSDELINLDEVWVEGPVYRYHFAATSAR